MANVTANYSLPYLELADPPNLATGLQNLAQAVDPILLRMDTQPTMQVFTANGTYAKPAGLKGVRVRVVGAGGGGGASSLTGAGNASVGGGGGGGGYSERYIPAASLAASESVTVGAAGTAGVAGSGTPGGTGGTSSFGAFLSATGGAGGGYGSQSTATTTGGGNGGTGTGGTLNAPGQPGARSRILMGEPITPGWGGSSALGWGADSAPATTAAAGTAGVGFGGGGSGSLLRQSQPASLAGGAGAPGVVIVESFF